MCGVKLIDVGPARFAGLRGDLMRMMAAWAGRAPEESWPSLYEQGLVTTDAVW